MNILILDIETFPNIAYVWGTNQQFVPANHVIDSGYTMCWSAKWYRRRKVFYASIAEDGEERMLERIWQHLDEADVVVHYNGEKFDIPTLNKEFLLRGWRPPAPFHQVDLLKTVRRVFRFPSNKLDYVAQALGIGAKTKHIGMDMWVGCSIGDPSALKSMKRYNKRDVRITEKLYRAVLPWIKGHPNHGLYTVSNRPVCKNCGSRHVQCRGVRTTVTQMYQRYRCRDCGKWQRGRSTLLSTEAGRHILTD